MNKFHNIKKKHAKNVLNGIDRNSVDNKWFRYSGILLVGICMPLIFFKENEGLNLISWLIISFSITFLVWEGSRFIVSIIWLKYPWEKSPVKHVILSVVYLATLSLLLIIVIYFINYFFTNNIHDYWVKMTGVNVAIVLLTFFTTSIYEGIFLFQKWKRSLVLATSLEKETILSQFETLKTQMNPHFLFNSLSNLESLILNDQQKAVAFVSQFSKIYRYVLDVKDEIAVEIKQEMEFVQSYIFLQKIRFEDNLVFKNSIDSECLEKLVLPLSIQVLIENAIKHNEISDVNKLIITLSNTKTGLVVSNNIFKKENENNSTKTGLKNLMRRYELVSKQKPEFYVKDNNFIAEIPFFKTE